MTFAPFMEMQNTYINNENLNEQQCVIIRRSTVYILILCIFLNS